MKFLISVIKKEQVFMIWEQFDNTCTCRMMYGATTYEGSEKL